MTIPFIVVVNSSTSPPVTGIVLIIIVSPTEGVTTEFKKALDKQMESQSPEMKKKIAAVAEGYEGQTEKMKQDFLKKIMSDMDSNLPDMEKTEKQKYALSILNYAWAAAGSKGG